MDVESASFWSAVGQHMAFHADIWPTEWQKPLTSYCVRHRLFGVIKNISSLALNLISLRVLSAIGLIVALWICPVPVFANLGLYLAAVNLAALGVFGRYELLVVSAANERKYIDATHLCILTSAGAVLAAFGFAIAARSYLDLNVTLLFSGALFARAWLRLGLVLATRHGRYNQAVRALLPHAIGQPIILVWLIFLGHNPLFAFVMSDFIGHMLAAGCVCFSERSAFGNALRGRIQFRNISKLAAVNYRLPTLNLIAVTAAFFFASMPLFLLPSLSNGALAGTLALMFRLLDVPANLTSTSLSPVLVKELVDRSHNGILLTSKSLLLLPAGIAALVFGLISLGGLTLNALELAPSWHMAFTILPVVALFQAGIAATGPLIDIATLAGCQKPLLALNTLSVGMAGTALLLWSSDPVFAILIAGSIGVGRVIILSSWLIGSGAYSNKNAEQGFNGPQSRRSSLTEPIQN